MFAGYNIDAITNGIHAATWTQRAVRHNSMTDIYQAGNLDNCSLRYA